MTPLGAGLRAARRPDQAALVLPDFRPLAAAALVALVRFGLLVATGAIVLTDFRPLAAAALGFCRLVEALAILAGFPRTAEAPLPTALASGTSIRRPLFTS
jgi:hypothetical protein